MDYGHLRPLKELERPGDNEVKVLLLMVIVVGINRHYQFSLVCTIHKLFTVGNPLPVLGTRVPLLFESSSV